MNAFVFDESENRKYPHLAHGNHTNCKIIASKSEKAEKMFA